MFNPMAFNRLGEQVRQSVEKVRTLSITLRDSSEFLADELGDSIVHDMKTRTSLGFDADGRRFTPYSAKYRKRTGKKQVNLRLTGRMLDSLVYISSRNGTGIITVLPGKNDGITSARLARIHQTGAGNMPRRRFFGWDKAANETQMWRRMSGLLNKRIQPYF